MADVEGWEVGTFYGHKVYKVGHYNSGCGVVHGSNKQQELSLRVFKRHIPFRRSETSCR